MSTTRDCMEHVSAFVGGLTTLVFGNLADKGVMESAVPGATLIGLIGAAVVSKNQDHAVDSRRAVAKIIRDTAKDWRFDFQRHDDIAKVSYAEEALIEFLPQCNMSHERLAHCAVSPEEFPDAAVSLVMEELARLDGDQFSDPNSIGASFARAVLRAAFRSAVKDRKYFEKLQPHLLIEMAQGIGDVRKSLRTLRDALLERMDRLEALMEDMSANIADMKAAQKDSALTDAQILNILNSFDLSGIPVERWETSLMQSAEKLKELESKLAAQNQDEPEIAVLLDQAREAIDAADFDKADALLAEAERRDLEAGERRLTRAARSIEQRATLAAAEGRYIEAAGHSARAAEFVRPFDAMEWARLKFNEGYYLYERGQYDPERGTLDRAIAAYEAALEEYTREHTPQCWADTQTNLGSALAVLGGRGNDAALKNAITAFEAALEERTRERTPLDWAMAQNNLGNTLLALGERGDDDALEKAIIAYKAALEEYSRERAPLDWAMTQNNLGNALATVGKRGDDDALKKAIIAYKAALEECSRERAPLDWAMTQNNLGNALATLGKRGDEAALNKSVSAFEAALEERTRERTPLQWAMTQNNLGGSMDILGNRTGDVSKWEQAAAHFRAALEEWEGRAPAYEKIAQRNLARVEEKLANSAP